MERIISKASWKKSLLSMISILLIYWVINYSAIGVAGLLKVTGGASILDFEFGFDINKATEMLTALGDDGRNFYQSKILPLDILFPLTYMFFYLTWMAFFLKNLSAPKIFNYLLLLPFLAMIADWLENVGIWILLQSYPDLPSNAVCLASISGMFKFVFIISNWAVLLLLLVILIIKRIRAIVGVRSNG